MEREHYAYIKDVATMHKPEAMSECPFPDFREMFCEGCPVEEVGECDLDIQEDGSIVILG